MFSFLPVILYHEIQGDFNTINRRVGVGDSLLSRNGVGGCLTTGKPMFL